jgi:DNA-binding MarR family transcriptional regulator
MLSCAVSLIDSVLSNMPDSRSAAGQALAELTVRVLRLEGMLSAAGDSLAAPLGQTSARWRVLAAVEDEPRSVAEIARAWSLARQSVQRVADLLADDGLVAYEDNPRHRRAKLVRLTPRGAATLGEIQTAQRAWANAVGERLVERDLQAASRILSDVIDTLAEDPSSPIARSGEGPAHGGPAT